MKTFDFQIIASEKSDDRIECVIVFRGDEDRRIFLVFDDGPATRRRGGQVFTKFIDADAWIRPS